MPGRRRMNVLAGTLSFMTHATDEIELLQKICSIMVDTGGYRMAWVGYAEHDHLFFSFRCF